MKFLLCDDHAVFRAGLRVALAEVIGDGEVFEAETAEEALQKVDAHPDLDMVLLDLDLAGTDGLTVLASLRKTHAHIPVVIVSGTEDPNLMRRSLEAGASGMIPKSAKGSVLWGAVRLVLAGGVYIPPAVLGAVRGPSPASEAAATAPAETQHQPAPSSKRPSPAGPAPETADPPSPPAVAFAALVGDADSKHRDERDPRLSAIADALEAHSGREIDRGEDGLLLSFERSLDALRFAVRVQQRLAADRSGGSHGLGVGIHVALPSESFGQCALLATLIADEASDGEILLSPSLHATAAGVRGLELGPERSCALGEPSGPKTLWPLRWQSADS